MDQSIDGHISYLRTCGIVAIVRGEYPPDAFLRIAEALLEGGVTILEVTLNTSDALEGIRRLRREVGENMLVGAGTVRTVADVDRAYDAGAQFTVAPNFDPESVRRARERKMLHVPGIFTASEAQAAYAAGCDVVKLFPATLLGPEYLRSLRAPLDDVEFMPTGGVDATNARAFLRAGAIAVGVGSALIQGVEQDAEDLAARAARLVSICAEHREDE